MEACHAAWTLGPWMEERWPTRQAWKTSATVRWPALSPL
jgi:hypothetical protein